MLSIYFRVKTGNTSALNIFPHVEKYVGTFLAEVGFVNLSAFIVVILVPLLIELIHDKGGIVSVAQSAVVVYDAVKVVLCFYFLAV